MTDDEFGKRLKDYLRENGALVVHSPSYKDSTMRISLVIDGEEIIETSVWESDLPGNLKW